MLSQAINWTLVKADQLVYQGHCELISAHLAPSGASTGNVIYDGQGPGGKEVLTLESATRTLTPFIPPVPIFCDQGIYVDIGSNTEGILIQWRPAE